MVLKGAFPEFQVARDKDSAKIWADAVFVFDTNCLLNLYRYTGESFDQFMAALEYQKEKIWIPYHVALEFQRNRLRVIAERNRKVADLRSALDKLQSDAVDKIKKMNAESRQTLIDPKEFSHAMEAAMAPLISKITEIEKSQKKVHEPDDIKAKLEEIFEGRIGDPPKDQTELDLIQAEADRRIKEKIPPGFQDKSKANGEEQFFYHSTLKYNRSAGDYIIWYQILSYLRDKECKALVFVTDDSKEDWWWEVKDGASKTLGPRPELTEEAMRLGGVSDVAFYDPTSFLRYFSEISKSTLSPKVLSEVKSISEEQAAIYNSNTSSVTSVDDLESPRISEIDEAVINFLLEKGDAIGTTNSFPRFEFDVNGVQSYGEVVEVESWDTILTERKKIKNRLAFLNNEEELSPFFVFWVCNRPAMAAGAYNRLRLGNFPRRSERIYDVPGFIKKRNGRPIFFPINPDIPLPKTDLEKSVLHALLS